MRRTCITFFALFAILFCLPATAQDASPSKKQQIANLLTEYFKPERENIHAQFDKDVFLTNETVWFKGYVFHRKNNVPFFATVNVYATLMDDKGKVLDTKLLYANIGSFTGQFELNRKMPTGKYYIQFYTNWMNNFTEDESFVHEFTVINENDDPAKAFRKPDPSQINIEINPEGGSFISGTANSFGVRVSDCNHNPMAVKEAELVSGAGKTLKLIQINRLGYGKFDLGTNEGAGYKIRVSANNTKFEQPLPQPQLQGVALEVNNYGVAGKTIIKIRANATVAGALAGKPVYVLVQQDGQVTVAETALSAQQQEVTISLNNTDVFEGLNTIRILDDNLNELASRIIYKYPQSVVTADLKVAAANYETAEITGKAYPNMNLSVSILPSGTASASEKEDIYGSFLIYPYISNYYRHAGRYYFATLTKGKHYELDLFLMNQQSKYRWQDILKGPNKETFTFDMGLTLKAKVPQKVPDKKMYKIRLNAYSPFLNEFTGIDENDEFTFNNLILNDSTVVKFTLAKPNDKAPQNVVVHPQVVNGGRKYLKMYKPPVYRYAAEDPVTAPSGGRFAKPQIQNGEIQLEEVVLEAKRLKYAHDFGNANLVGDKITEANTNSYTTVLQYIKNRSGFDVIDSPATGVQIYGRSRTTVNGGRNSPQVFIDNVEQMDFSILQSIQLSEVDEIYMSTTVIVPSVRNKQGKIKIYLKKGVRLGKQPTVPEIIVRGGFEPIKAFENVSYGSFMDEGFTMFGLVDWKPVLMADEQGEFKFSVPVSGQKEVKLLIEGFSADGKLISEIKTLQINN